MQFDQLRRRKFITLLGGAALLGRLRRARSNRGCRSSVWSALGRLRLRGTCLAAFRRGLKENGYVEGENVAIDIAGRMSIRPAAGAGGRSGAPTGRRDRHDRRYRFGVAAKAATTTIPIVFASAKTRSGLALSPASPGPAAT